MFQHLFSNFPLMNDLMKIVPQAKHLLQINRLALIK